jgi:hypothetical protein
MVFDADEFVSIKHGDGTLEGMISDAVAKGANGIVITWRIWIWRHRFMVTRASHRAVFDGRTADLEQRLGRKDAVQI